LFAGAVEKPSFYTVTARQLEKEAVLELPFVKEKAPDWQFRHILLTGATGYLGAYLLRELLQKTKARLYCLVRSANLTAARDKILRQFHDFPVSASEQDRIVPVLGDLSRKKFGIPEAEFASLAETIDAIYHNGALVHFLYSYQDLKAVNVKGTEEVLKFAAYRKVKPVFYSSTISIFSCFGVSNKTVPEDEDIRDSGILPIGYTQSKWVAERLVWKAKERGLPVAVFRIGHIVGNSDSGECNADDFIFRVAKSILAIRAYPNMYGQISPVAVDDVARSIIGISLDKRNMGKAYHIINEVPVSVAELLDWTLKKGIVLQPMERKEWAAAIEKLGSDGALFPFLKYFDDELWDQAGDLEYSVHNTREALHQAGIRIKPMSEALFDKYFRYLKEKGEIESQERYVSGSL
jgi:thioester reductase-like protein